jgi:hypothetical protein
VRRAVYLIVPLVLAGCGGSSTPITSQAPSTTATQAHGRSAQTWDQERADFDYGTGSWAPGNTAGHSVPSVTGAGIRALRPYFRNLVQPCIDATTFTAAHNCAIHVQSVLAHPDSSSEAPTQYSVAKELHVWTREFGDDALHLLNRAG